MPRGCICIASTLVSPFLKLCLDSRLGSGSPSIPPGRGSQLPSLRGFVSGQLEVGSKVEVLVEEEEMTSKQSNANGQLIGRNGGTCKEELKQKEHQGQEGSISKSR